MPTHRLFIPASAFMPDTSGNVYPKPSRIDLTNDKAVVELLAFKDSSTKIGAAARFQVPDNYAGTPKLQIIWMANAVSNAAVWDVDFYCVAVGENLDPSTPTESETVTTTTNGTIFYRNESEVTPTGSNFAAEDLVLLEIFRDGTDSNDTLSGVELLLEGVAFEYSDT